MDPVTIASVASAVVPVLAPALRHLVKVAEKVGEKGGGTFAETAGKEIGENTWETAKSLWGRLGGKILERPAALEAARDVAKNPGDDDLKAVLKVQIRKILEENPALAQDVAKILKASARLDADTIEDSEFTVQKIGVVTPGVSATADMTAKTIKKSTFTVQDIGSIGGPGPDPKKNDS